MKSFEFRGLMLDMARVTERHTHYLALPQHLAAWGYDTIFAHLTDNEGCAITLSTRPELTTPHAMTRQQLREWIDTAGEYGISIVPEIECFGHTKYIHGIPKYKHLAVPATGSHNAIDPTHPDTHAVIRDLIAETADIFDSPYIHAGFDEVNLEDHSTLPEGVRDKPNWQIYADFLNLVYEMVRAVDRKMMIWGDHLVSDARIAELIPKDIIVCDWQYHGDLTPHTTRSLLEMGFDVICCPATVRSGDMIMPRANTLSNLQRFSRIAHGAGEHVRGLVNTCWCPARMLCDTELFAFALGGAWFADPEADPRPVVSRFVKERYGIGRPGAVADAILQLAVVMPHNSLIRRTFETEVSRKSPCPPVTSAEMMTTQQTAEITTRLRRKFERAAEQVESNRDEFDNYLLVCDILAWAARLAAYRLKQDPVASRDLKTDGMAMLKRCRKDWARRRYQDDPMREADAYSERDGLITNLAQAVAGLA